MGYAETVHTFQVPGVVVPTGFRNTYRVTLRPDNGTSPCQHIASHYIRWVYILPDVFLEYSDRPDIGILSLGRQPALNKHFVQYLAVSMTKCNT